MESSIESMESSLHFLKYNLNLVMNIRMVHHMGDDELHDVH